MWLQYLPITTSRCHHSAAYQKELHICHVPYTHIFCPLSTSYLYIISMKQVQAKQGEHKHINEPDVYLKGQYNLIQGQL